MSSLKANIEFLDPPRVPMVSDIPLFPERHAIYNANRLLNISSITSDDKYTYYRTKSMYKGNWVGCLVKGSLIKEFDEHIFKSLSFDFEHAKQWSAPKTLRFPSTGKLSLEYAVNYLTIVRLIYNLGVNRPSDLISIQGKLVDGSPVELLLFTPRMSMNRSKALDIPVQDEIFFSFDDIGGEKGLFEIVSAFVPENGKYSEAFNALFGTVLKYYIEMESEYDLLQNQYELIKRCLLEKKADENSSYKLLCEFLYSDDFYPFINLFECDTTPQKMLQCWLERINKMRNKTAHHDYQWFSETENLDIDGRVASFLAFQILFVVFVLKKTLCANQLDFLRKTVSFKHARVGIRTVVAHARLLDPTKHFVDNHFNITIEQKENWLNIIYKCKTCGEKLKCFYNDSQGTIRIEAFGEHEKYPLVDKAQSCEVAKMVEHQNRHYKKDGFPTWI